MVWRINPHCGFPVYYPNYSPLFAYSHVATSIYSISGWTASPLAETTLYTCTIPGNAMGSNGTLRAELLMSGTSSANQKIYYVRYAGNAIATVWPTTAALWQFAVIIRNRNATNSQITFQNGTSLVYAQAAGGVPYAMNVDTTQNTNLTISATTSLETGFAATSCTRANNIVAVNATTHGLNTGEYVQILGATPSTFNVNPVMITKVDANNFTYSNSGANESTTVQPTVKRYSVIQLESVDVQILRA